MQAHYSLTPKERDMEQAVCRIVETPKGNCFHISQIWTIVLDNCTIQPLLHAVRLIEYSLPVHLFKAFHGRSSRKDNNKCHERQSGGESSPYSEPADSKMEDIDMVHSFA